MIKEVVVTNTIPLTPEASAARTEKGGKISVLSIAGLIGRAIQANHEETSVSKLFTYRFQSFKRFMSLISYDGADLLKP